MSNKFFEWYERNYTLNVGIAAGLFLIQIVHLIWLFAEVMWFKLTGSSLFVFTGVWKTIIVLVDYTEIPAIVTTSFVYINELRRGFSWKSMWLFIFINSQWLHLFWITDEFVVTAFSEPGMTVLPLWLAWVAILIDYLELPVIYDTIKKFIVSIRENKVEKFLKEDLRDA